VLHRLHAGLATPPAAANWRGSANMSLAAIDSAMTVKPDERPQSIADWLEMFGKPLEEDQDAEDGADESTHFYSQQVATEEIVPVATAPGGFEKATVETDVPTDPKQVRFKRLGRDTSEGRKHGTVGEATDAADATDDKKGAARKKAGAAASPAAAEAKTGDRAPAAEKPERKLSPVLVGAAAVGLLVIGGGSVFLLRGGSQAGAQNGVETLSTNAAQPATDPALAPNPVLDAAQNTAVPVATDQTVAPTDADTQLRQESAKAAAAEAKLAQMKRAADKAAKLQAAQSGAATTPGKPETKTAAATTSAAGSSSSGGGLSPGKVAQLNAIVDEGRAMAKQVMRSGNSQNAQLARNYDSYLKTAKDSMRGVTSDKEADRLIKQASQTRAYIQFLVKQSR
jgi:non-specific serine/threonine protein kinase